ncbi:hypothetical protein C8A05DRAFT_18292 [Staphylotrichum tortipilum]|uniref:Uncharacterized protein n=1 Tax=Staphylotrichum tortipilum TaxID=2831512 RepID=A0AAN6RQH7_9PEZI|nr:hypothetical protein C8A05DRAFT_18292 [Staphylotrichum longicolle]
MDGTTDAPDGADPADPPAPAAFDGLDILDIVPDGDLLLDVTFDTSASTLRAARKVTKPRPGQKTTAPVLKPRTRLGYRVRLASLRDNSAYFARLLSDTRFAEARAIEARLQELSLAGVAPSSAPAVSLPVVQIHEDDDATRSAFQSASFADLLRILHRVQPTAPSSPKGAVTLHALAVLAVLADRFDCTPIVSRYVTALKFKWPATQTRPASRDDGGPALSRAAEESLRQKILVAWLLDQPPRLLAATRELVMYGSRRWSLVGSEEDGGDEGEVVAAWWDLPDEIEAELHYRRGRVLETLASVQRHFLRLYVGRERQCKMGYDSSASCDSFHLGEMVRFFASRDLLSLEADFAASFSPTPYPFSEEGTGTGGSLTRDYATTDLAHLLAVLRQCPAYQLDRHHTGCGLRPRLLPVLDFVQAMLAAGAVAVSRQAWKADRRGASWLSSSSSSAMGNGGGVGGDTGGTKGDGGKRVFKFTRGLATDQRLRYEGAMAADRMARELFTADEWDWTAEDREDSRGVEFGRTAFVGFGR